jgi:hypothetical protein
VTVGQEERSRGGEEGGTNKIFQVTLEDFYSKLRKYLDNPYLEYLFYHLNNQVCTFVKIFKKKQNHSDSFFFVPYFVNFDFI